MEGNKKIDKKMRFGVLIILAIASNDSFWELLRWWNFISARNSIIYLIEIAVSIAYFLLVSYWDGTIRFFVEFQEKHPKLYKLISFVIKGINMLMICIMYAIEVLTIVLSAPEANHKKYVADEKIKAKERFLKRKALVVNNPHNWMVNFFGLVVCYMVMWLLYQWNIVTEVGLKYIACLSNVIILCISVIFIVKGYGDPSKELKEDENGLGD